MAAQRPRGRHGTVRVPRPALLHGRDRRHPRDPRVHGGAPGPPGGLAGPAAGRSSGRSSPPTATRPSATATRGSTTSRRCGWASTPSGRRWPGATRRWPRSTGGWPPRAARGARRGTNRGNGWSICYDEHREPGDERPRPDPRRDRVRRSRGVLDPVVRPQGRAGARAGRPRLHVLRLRGDAVRGHRVGGTHRLLSGAGHRSGGPARALRLRVVSRLPRGGDLRHGAARDTGGRDPEIARGAADSLARGSRLGVDGRQRRRHRVRAGGVVRGFADPAGD